MFQLIRLAPNIFILLKMGLAARVARKNRERGAQRFLRVAASIERHWRATPPTTRKDQFDTTMIHALLLQRAPYEQICSWGNGARFPAGKMKTAFEAYFADGDYGQALLAASDWCRATEVQVAPHQAEMKKFFARHGDDLSLRKMAEIFKALCETEADESCEATPSKSLVLTPAQRHIFLFRNYYEAHLALEATRWMQERTAPSASRAHKIASASQRDEYLGLPRFRVNDASLESLGMKPDELQAARRRALGG